MTTAERLDLLGALAPLLDPWTGPFDTDTLAAWLESELGSAKVLDGPALSAPGHHLSQARPLSPLLVVISGNTPHAACQSLLRTLVLGAKAHFKLPSAGLPTFEEILARLPEPLSALVETSRELPDDWQERFGGLVVYGSDDTIRWFSERVPPSMPFLRHGTRLAIARIDGAPAEAAPLAARDVSLFDQQGCLSLHNVYLSPGAGTSAREFAAMLADAMATFNRDSPRGELSLSESGAIATLRETARYRAANDPTSCQLWESPGSTQWTVIFEDDPTIQPSCLNRVVYVKPWPRDPSALGRDVRNLSGCALHPWTLDAAASLVHLPVSRVCPLGSCQTPPTTWHHDGLPALGALVRWIDLA